MELLFSEKMKPKPNALYHIHNPQGIKLLFQLRLGLSHPSKNRFNRSFENCINPLGTCSLEADSISHFHFHCHRFNSVRLALFEELKKDKNLPKLSDDN